MALESSTADCSESLAAAVAEAAGVASKATAAKRGRRALCIELRSLAYSLLMLSRRRGDGGGKAVEAAA